MKFPRLNSSKKTTIIVASVVGVAVLGGTTFALWPEPTTPVASVKTQKQSEPKQEQAQPVPEATIVEVHDAAPAESHNLPRAASEPEPVVTEQTVTVSAYESITLDAIGNTDCKYIYSDNTTYQWHWRTVKEQGSWMTDSSGNNGRWVPATTESGVCDATAVGRIKSN